ncbi:hypothetical protein IMCC3317_44110 [Kordia antarctica]|uniref:Uncharacterized protein n=2 Tax=Kordia antarctica TaxID=1218801 RepID=A0A7L4ZR54_9FLAO|nr:hypothetical protein IMCC3317_44110 [Kordia antarctica]
MVSHANIGMYSIVINFNILYVMKKKEFNLRLNLRKNVISNLDSNQIKGGTNPIVITIQFTVQFTTLVTKPEVCETHGDVCTLYCETKEICNY